MTKLSLKSVLSKELKTSLRSFLGPASIAAYCLTYAIGILIVSINGGDARMTKMLDEILPVFVVLIPLITWGTFSQEEQQGTMLYIDRFRGSKKNLVLGKLLVQMLLFTIPVLALIVVSFIFKGYGSTHIMGEIPGIFTFWLLGLCLISISMLVASYCEKPWMAVCTTFCLFAIDYLIPSVAMRIGSYSVMTAVSNLSLFYQYRYTAIGYPDIRPILVYAILAAAAILLTIRSLEVRRDKA